MRGPTRDPNLANNILGLPTPGARAAPPRRAPRLQVLDEDGICALLVDVFELVGVVRQVVELFLSVLVFDVLVGPGPDCVEGCLVRAATFVSFPLSAGALPIEKCLKEDSRTPRRWFFAAHQRRQRASVGLKFVQAPELGGGR